MKTNTASTTQELMSHFIQQLWVHDWGYIVFVGVLLAIDAVATQWLRGLRRRKSWRR